MPGTRRLLAVVSHPDDETFGMGGTLALYAQQGVEIYLLCATRGEAGQVDPEYLTDYASVADLRVAELACASKALGLWDVAFLKYRDSGMPGASDNQHPLALTQAPMDALVQEVTTHMREVRPQVVITFDPMGGYQHPDHIKIHQATLGAFFASGDQRMFPDSLPVYTPQKLYFNTISRRTLRWIVRLMPLFGKDPQKFGRNGDINLRAIAEIDYRIDAKIDFSQVSMQRAGASRCYASQGGRQSNRGVAGLLRGWANRYEIFMRGYPEFPPEVIERDLFEGVSSDI